ncbi:MAG: sporulation-delaying protein SdpB family protein [Bacteroidota bacterium]
MPKLIPKSIGIFTNIYGLSRSFFALSLLITLLFTKSYVYFPPEFFQIGQLSKTIVPNLFYLFEPENLNIALITSCLILVAVISGFLPQLTGILHAWVAYSFFTGALIIEGGDQIGQIIAILLIPVTLFDKRINHWHKKDFFGYKRPEWISFFCYSCLVIIQIQMAIVYFFAVAEKINSPEWADGSAFYYWFNHNPFGVVEPIANSLNPIISNPYITPLITWGVLVLEALLFGALFMKREHKLLMFRLGIGFHFMIIVVHGLWSFFFAMAGGLIIYLLPWDQSMDLKFWRKWAN